MFAGRPYRSRYREFQSLVKAVQCQRCDLRYQYNPILTVLPWILPSNPSTQDCEEWKEAASPLAAYHVDGAIVRLPAGGGQATSQEFLGALKVLRNLRELDEE